MLGPGCGGSAWSSQLFVDKSGMFVRTRHVEGDDDLNTEAVQLIGAVLGWILGFRSIGKQVGSMNRMPDTEFVDQQFQAQHGRVTLLALRL